MVRNKGPLVGQKKALKLEEIWRIRTRLELERRDKELTLFNLAIDSKLRACGVVDLGLDSSLYGTHSLRRTKASLIYAQTKNLRAIQLLLGHTKLDSTIQYLGVELEDALTLSEKIED